MQRITPFDPTVAAKGGTFPLLMPSGGWLVMINESTVGLLLLFGNGQMRVIPPFFLRAMRITGRQDTCTWAQDYVITGANAPQGLSIVTGETYGPDEWTEGELFVALPRLVNVGNGVPGGGGTTASVTNDGNAAGAVVVEATAAGSASSNVLIDNDGTIHIKVVSNGLLTEVLAIVPGGATTPATFTLTKAALDKITSDGGKITSDGLGSLTLSSGQMVVQRPGALNTNDDILIIQRLAGTGGTANLCVFGIDSSGAVYCFDQNAGAFPFREIAGALAGAVLDGALATVRNTRTFIGTVDPATYTTVNEGDRWINK